MARLRDRTDIFLHRNMAESGFLHFFPYRFLPGWISVLTVRDRMPGWYCAIAETE